MLLTKSARTLMLLPLTLFFLTENCATARKIEKHSNFDYENIYNKQYIDGNGGIIRLTLEKGETYGGSITPDRKYLFYTSNRDGNFDIFLRPLNDIVSIPVIRDATNQTEPAISPDGKHLLFVDDELDPEGDIVMVNINPASVVKTFSASGQPAIDALFINSKQYITNDPENINRSRESNPAWSADGKWIAYASNKASAGGDAFGPGFGARQNIWIMPFEKPEKARQLTTEGGILPSFSPDGKKILYVNDNNGDRVSHIYEIDINNGVSRQLTFENAIDLSPCYSTNGKNIIFTRIYNDSNHDGVTDYKDHGQIMIMPVTAPEVNANSTPENKPENRAIQLTSKNENIFNSKVTDFLGGSVLFAVKEADNINLAVIPESGIFPVRKSILKQLDFALKLSETAPDDGLTALAQIEYTHDTDPLKEFASVLKDFELLNRYTSLSLDKKKLVDQIVQKSNHDLFEKALLDLYFLNHPGEESGDEPESYAPLFPEKSLEQYLQNIYENPQSVLNVSLNPNTANEIQFKALSKKDQSIIGYLFEQYAATLYQKGKIGPATKIYQFILANLPEYNNNASILYLLGKNSFDTDIPPEFLHIISPNQHPYLINADLNEKSDENQKKESINESVKEKPAAKEKFIKIIVNNNVKSRVENDIFNFFVNAYSQSQDESIDLLKEKYSKKTDPLIYSLIQLSLAHNLSDQREFEDAMLTLQGIDVGNFRNSEWIFKYYLLQGQLQEKTNRMENAYESYVNALMQYENKYQSTETNDLIFQVFDYYGKLAAVHKKNANMEKAWNAYAPLLKLILYLEPKKISKNVIEQSSLAIFIEMDEMLLNNYHIENKTVKQVLGFYDANIAFARKNTINSFIFGRAYLNAMLGIKLHKLYESNRELNKVNKQNVLNYFYEAEEDFQWSIYADATFAEAYVTLGWMYQFIDEKRDSIIYLSKSGNETDIDKNLFKSLYEKYFPDYLFEKNIQLYQKSIAFLSARSSNQTLRSFYLNLANNYFLLNNYSKAEENYSKVSAEGTDKYIFEGDDQSAQFYFHRGKTNYFLGNYEEAVHNFEKTLIFYPVNSPKSNSSPNTNYWQRSMILKYMGLVFSDSGRYKKAVDVYKQILTEAGQIKTNENFSQLYLEIARNLLAHIKVSHDLHNINEALDFTYKAESAIKKFPEVPIPKFLNKIKILGLPLFDIYFGNYDNYIKGNNHLAFRLPGINQYQYLYSIQTDLYKLNGNYSKAREAVKKLIDYTDKDDTKHGREARLTAFMRLGELAYVEGNLTVSKDAYTQARNLAFSTDKMVSYYLSEKNLMSIGCREIDQSTTNKQKSELSHARLLELNEFKNNYIKLKQSQTLEEITKKNKNMKLTLAEINRIEKEAIAEIGGILIYQAIFEAYISHSDEINDLNVKGLDFNSYYDYKMNHYKKNISALISLDGNLTVNNTKVVLFDKKKKKQLFMKLDMNKALVLESMGRIREAMDIYSDISNRAWEFKAYDLFIVSGFKYYTIARLLAIDAQKTLRNLDLTFKLNPYLVKKHAEIYQNLNGLILNDNIKNRQYYNAIRLENYNRMRELQNTVDLILNKTGADMLTPLNEYREFDIIEEVLSTDIENLKIKRESTSALDAIMEQLLRKKQSLMQTILKNPQLAGYAMARFPEILTINDIMSIKPGFLYLVNRDGITNAFYKYEDENTFEFSSFKINTVDLNKFIESTKNPDFTINDSEEIDGELKRFIKWIRARQFQIVFPDKSFSFFPFSKILKYNVAREYTLQAALLFRKNQTVAATNWLQNVNDKIRQDDLAEKNRNIYNYVTRIEDVQKFSGKYNAVDYEITENDFTERSLLLNKIINNNQNTALTLLSYNLKNRDNLVLYMNSLNLVFAASRSTIVVHTLLDRKSSSENYNKIINHQITGDENLLFDGNINISDALFNINKNENVFKLIQYENDDLHKCITQTDNFVKSLSIQEAIENLDICEKMDYNVKTSQLVLKERLNKDTIRQIKPDFKIMDKKLELMLQPKSGIKLSAIQKYFDVIKNNFTFADGSLDENYYKLLTKYISLLYAAGETQAASNMLKNYPEDYKPTDEDIIHITGGYYSGQMNAGNIEAFSKELPVELSSLSQNRPFYNDIPADINEKTGYFIEKDNHPETWLTALINSGEYAKLRVYFANSKFNISTSKSLSFLASTKKLPPGNFDSKDVEWMQQLVENPKNTDLYLKITNYSNDNNIKSFADLIVFLANKNYDKISNLASGFLTNKDKDADVDFFVKHAFISFVMNHVDYHSMPEDFISGICKIISSTKFDSEITNKQQKVFTKLAASTSAFINNPGEFNKFLMNYADALSTENIKYIQLLKTLSIQENPFEVLKHVNDKINPAFQNSDYNESMIIIENQTKDIINNSTNYKDFSLATLYQINSNNYQKALSGYFAYDRNQKPESFAFTKSFHGIFKIFFDQYYHWKWFQNKIEITKIKFSEIDKMLQQNKNDIFYLPAKDDLIENKLLSNDNGLHYLATAFNIKPLENEDQLSSELSWNFSPELRNTPGYSILNMYLPRATEYNRQVHVSFNSGINDKALINFYAQPMTFEYVKKIENNWNSSNFHVIYSKPEIENLYLTFMKEFVKQSLVKMDQPTVIFDMVFKKFEKKYSNTNDLKYLFILQK
jgi:Tol biopolymer transport system component/predicted negative regulator of RcsB-dependent stress response